MKNTLVQNSIVLLSGAALAMQVACAPENPRMMAPPTTYGAAAVEAKPVVATVTPQVDVLMVIDNSASMKDEQITLSENIDKFALGLAKNNNIDFHIGVVSVWDSITFEGMKKEYGQGELRKLLDPKGNKLPDSFGRYVSSKTNYDEYLTQQGFSLGKEPGWLQVLRASMKIGIEEYVSGAKEKGVESGPEFEEVFTPVQVALGKSMPPSNVGFRRASAHLVIVFITDTDASVKNADGTAKDLSPGELKSFLETEVVAKGTEFTEAVTILGALAHKNDAEGERDPAIRYAAKGPTEPVNMNRFFADTGGQAMRLRGKEYGSKMAQFGTYVRTKALTRPRIQLGGVPEWNSVDVSLNGVKLEQGKDWLYDFDRNKVEITHDLSKIEGVVDVKVNFTPITAGSLLSGRVKPALKK